MNANDPTSPIGASLRCSLSAILRTAVLAFLTAGPVFAQDDDTDGDGLLDDWERQHNLNMESGLATSLVGWWRFDETSGTTVYDHSGYGNDAEILVPDHVERVVGAPVGGALRFDGEDDPGYYGVCDGYVRVQGLTNAPLSGGFTVAAWVRADSYPRLAPVVSKTSDVYLWPDGFFLYDDGGLSFLVGAATNQYPHGAVGSGIETENEWMHLCGVYRGTNASIYVNGNLIGSGEPAGPLSNTGCLWIGTLLCAANADIWHGDVADVRLYTSALSQAQILDLLETYADPDADDLSNLQEQTAGTDPHDADTDDGGLPDGWEVDHLFDPLDPSDDAADSDNDGLSNALEYALGLDPFDPDTDGDGLPDGWEQTYGLNPKANDASADTDGDGVSNLSEYLRGSDPCVGSIASASLRLTVLTPLE